MSEKTYTARLEETELGDSYWIVPESALEDFVPPKPGPVPKSEASGGDTLRKDSKK